MSVKPILFNADIVRAILDGRKTVIRRVIKEKLPKDPQWGYTVFTPQGKISCRGIFEDRYVEAFYKLPYQPGDILYVRETWSHNNFGFHYLADLEDRWMSPDDKWHPSIHMPKEAARIWLKVTDVRVERLRNITFEGIAKEGINPKLFEDENGVSAKDFANAYISLWDSTIKKKDLLLYGWEADPWVWVIEFERCERPK